MAGNTFGKIFQLHTFGESHGKGVGGIIDGCPAGLKIDFDFIQQELARRKTNQGIWASPRNEPDEVIFLSGIFEGITLGTPIAFIIENKGQNSKDYEHLKNIYRPSHADYTYEQKYGIRDYRGGGRSSARETLARVVGGAIAKLFLKEKYQIEIIAYVSQIGSIKCNADVQNISLDDVEQSPLRCPDNKATQEMLQLIENTKKEGDTLGGIITCIAKKVPVGLGEPVFDKLNAVLSYALFSINAVKGVEIGDGFAIAEKKGSEANDEMYVENNQIKFKTNHSGGIQGGISNGNDIIIRVAFKPISSIKKEQMTVTTDKHPASIQIQGRHDVCIVPRAVPIVESMIALVLADMILQSKLNRL